LVAWRTGDVVREGLPLIEARNLTKDYGDKRAV